MADAQTPHTVHRSPRPAVPAEPHTVAYFRDSSGYALDAQMHDNDIPQDYGTTPMQRAQMCDLDDHPPEDVYNQHQPTSSVLLNPFTARLTRPRRSRGLQDVYNRLGGACCRHSTFLRMVGKISCGGLGRFRAT